MADTKDYIQSIILSLKAIEAFSFVNEAECRRVLKEVDDELDTLRTYLEGE